MSEYRICRDSSFPDAATDEWWYLFHKGAYVGRSAAKRFDSELYYLTWTEVHPEHRGKGLHKRLIRARLKHARREGYKACITYTLPHVTNSSNNLIDCGFRLYRPETLWADEEALYWWKEL